MNRHTGAVLIGPGQKLPRSLVSILRPEFPLWVKALVPIRSLYKAFYHYSTKYHVDLPDIRPILRDLKIIEKETTEKGTKREVFVEAKSAHCRIITNRVDGTTRLHHQANAVGDETRLIFSWRAEWDYLYIVATNKQALLLLRDRILREWWNNVDGQRNFGGWLEWPSNESFDQYLLPMDFQPHLVETIETIIEAGTGRP